MGLIVLNAIEYSRAADETRPRFMKKILLIFFLLIITAVLAAEAGVRKFGLLEYPLYDANNRIGYIPSPSQSGVYDNGIPWAFNADSMGTAEEFLSTNKDVLLIGDSLVFGGDLYRPSEQLASNLEKASGNKVWPISANSWGLQNEVQYMNDHLDIVRDLEGILILSNAADFDGPSSWASKFTHPRSKPTVALPYLFCRVFCRGNPVTPEALLVPRRDPIEDLRKFAADTGKPIVMWLYADWQQTENPAERDKSFSSIIDRLNRAAIPNLTVRKVWENGWALEDYRDYIHQHPASNTKLAEILATDMPKIGGADVIATVCTDAGSRVSAATSPTCGMHQDH